MIRASEPPIKYRRSCIRLFHTRFSIFTSDLK
jgi:hypothetical protein